MCELDISLNKHNLLWLIKKHLLTVIIYFATRFIFFMSMMSILSLGVQEQEWNMYAKNSLRNHFSAQQMTKFRKRGKTCPDLHSVKYK